MESSSKEICALTATGPQGWLAAAAATGCQAQLVSGCNASSHLQLLFCQGLPIAHIQEEGLIPLRVWCVHLPLRESCTMKCSPNAEVSDKHKQCRPGFQGADWQQCAQLCTLLMQLTQAVVQQSSQTTSVAHIGMQIEFSSAPLRHALRGDCASGTPMHAALGRLDGRRCPHQT